MDMLKKLFPFAFTNKADILALVINLIVQLVAGALIGWVFALLAQIPFIGWLLGTIGSLIGLYILVSIVLSVLDYLKILK